MRLILLLTGVCGAMLGIAVWRTWPEQPHAGSAATPLSSMAPADARQQELLEENIDRPGEETLGRAYEAINLAHFNGALPVIPIRWEPALEGIGALASGRFSVEGMVGRVGDRMVMLLNPRLNQDRAAFDRALSHEMVHVYLYSKGDTTAHHGEAFKAVLQRLSEEGAFEGIPGTETEKMTLRAWLDAESARIDADERELTDIGGRIIVERAALEAESAALTVRTESQAVGQRPTAQEMQTLETRRAEFNQLVLETNERLERGREALAHFNAEVERYNLMMAYPDGMDEDSIVPAKVTSR